MKLFFSTLLFSLCTFGALAITIPKHSGGTDSSGCHCVGGKDRDGSCPSGDYHCH